MVWQVALNRGIFSCSIKTLQQQCSRRNIHVTKLVSSLTKGQGDKLKILPRDGAGRDILTKFAMGHEIGKLIFFCQDPGLDSGLDSGQDNHYFFQDILS